MFTYRDTDCNVTELQHSGGTQTVQTAQNPHSTISFENRIAYKLWKNDPLLYWKKEGGNWILAKRKRTKIALRGIADFKTDPTTFSSLRHCSKRVHTINSSKYPRGKSKIARDLFSNLNNPVPVPISKNKRAKTVKSQNCYYGQTSMAALL